MKAIEQYFHVVLFIMLSKMVLTFKFVDGTVVCNLSNESYWAVLSCGEVWSVNIFKTKCSISSLNFFIACEICLAWSDRLLEILHARVLAHGHSFFCNCCTSNHCIKCRHACLAQFSFLMNCGFTVLDFVRVVVLMCDDVRSDIAYCSSGDGWLTDIDR